MHYGPEKNLVRNRTMKKLLEMRQQKNQWLDDKQAHLWVEFLLIPLTEPLRDTWCNRQYKEGMHRGEYQRYVMKSKFEDFRFGFRRGARTTGRACTCRRDENTTKGDRRLASMNKSEKRIFYGLLKAPEEWRREVLELAEKHPSIPRDDPNGRGTADWIIYDMVQYAHKKFLTILNNPDLVMTTATSIQTDCRLTRIEAISKDTNASLQRTEASSDIEESSDGESGFSEESEESTYDDCEERQSPSK